MKYILTLLSVYLFLLGCTGKKENIVFKSFEFEVDNVLVNSSETSYEVEKLGEEFKIKYCKESRCVNYLIKDKVGSYTTEKGDTFELVFDREIIYKVNGEIYPVKVYIVNRNAIDSETEHYWSPEFGVVLIKSITWGGFSVLTKLDNDKDDILNTLATIILKDQLLNKLPDQDLLETDSLLQKMIEEELK